ncbi:YjzD family protein [Enterococcus faecalis]
MRYIVVFFWTFVLGQIVGYIGGALAGGSYDFKFTTIISLVTALLILLIGHFAVTKPEDPSSAQ